MTRKQRIIIDQVKTKMRDGVMLRGDVFAANDLKIRRPTLLVRTPYGRNETSSKLDAIELARKGWAVIIQNVRGRYESEGEFNPFQQEYNDGFDTVEWCCQQSWSDGRVAMSGASYAGYTQWSCALARPKGLQAISPQITASDVRNEWFYEGQAFRQAFAQSWGLSLAFTKPNNSFELQREIWNLAENLPDLYNIPPNSSPLIKLLPAYSEWIDINNHKYWDKLPVLKRSQIVSLPSYHLTGWHDIFCEGSLKDFIRQQENGDNGQPRSIQRLVVGPWTHSAFLSQYAGDVDYGLQANGFVLNVMDEMHTWLRRALDKEEVEEGVKLFILGANIWKEFECFPPPNVSIEKLFLKGYEDGRPFGSKGILNKKPSEKGSRDHFEHNPAAPVPSLGGRRLDPCLPPAGPVNQSLLEGRNDILVYETPTLSEDITIIGSIRAGIFFSTSGESADVSVKLIDVYPDQKAFHIVGSAQRVSFTPNKMKFLEVILGSIAVTFKRGHRIRIDISSSNFPHLDINYAVRSVNSLESVRSLKQTVYSGAGNASFIEFPMIDLG